MAALVDVIEEVEPTSTSFELVISDHGAEIDRLEAEMLTAAREDARRNEPDRAPAIAQQIADLEAEAKKVAVTLCSVGQLVWSNLTAEHPPTDQQRKDGFDYNPDTFPYVAVAASMVEPTGAGEAEVRALASKLSAGRWKQLWGACLKVNMGVGSHPKSLTASAVLAATETK